MTTFEIIILSLIYIFCYGYTIAMFIKEEKVWLKLFLVIASLVVALYYAPFSIGGAVFEKLNNKNLCNN